MTEHTLENGAILTILPDGAGATISSPFHWPHYVTELSAVDVAAIVATHAGEELRGPSLRISTLESDLACMKVERDGAIERGKLYQRAQDKSAPTLVAQQEAYSELAEERDTAVIRSAMVLNHLRAALHAVESVAAGGDYEPSPYGEDFEDEPAPRAKSDVHPLFMTRQTSTGWNTSTRPIVSNGHMTQEDAAAHSWTLAKQAGTSEPAPRVSESIVEELAGLTHEDSESCRVCGELLDHEMNDNGDGEILGHTIDCLVVRAQEHLAQVARTSSPGTCRGEGAGTPEPGCQPNPSDSSLGGEESDGVFLDEFRTTHMDEPLSPAVLRHNAYATGWEHGAMDHRPSAPYWDKLRGLDLGLLDLYTRGRWDGEAARSRGWATAREHRGDQSGGVFESEPIIDALAAVEAISLKAKLEAAEERIHELEEEVAKRVTIDQVPAAIRLNLNSMVEWTPNVRGAMLVSNAKEDTPTRTELWSFARDVGPIMAMASPPCAMSVTIWPLHAEVVEPAGHVEPELSHCGECDKHTRHGNIIGCRECGALRLLDGQPEWLAELEKLAPRRGHIGPWVLKKVEEVQSWHAWAVDRVGPNVRGDVLRKVLDSKLDYATGRVDQLEEELARRPGHDDVQWQEERGEDVGVQRERRIHELESERLKFEARLQEKYDEGRTARQMKSYIDGTLAVLAEEDDGQ